MCVESVTDKIIRSIRCYHFNILLLFLQRKGSAVTSKSPPSAVATTFHTTVFSKGSSASYKKLSRFFGEAPPRVEDLESLLEALGYTHLLPVCGSV